jgi:feruloyl-CoA synthase
MAEHVRRALMALRGEGAGSSQTPTRVMLLPDTPQAPAGEITDKGYLNQRLVLTRRAAEVQALYDSPPDPRVIRP